MTPVFNTLRLGDVNITSGSGSPVGSVSGPAGSQYLDTSRGWKWRKTGGSGGLAWAQRLLRKPWTSIRDYGAVGSGAVDDRAAIQGAINAVRSAGGGVVFVPAGEYRCDITGSGVGGIPTFLFTGADQGNIIFVGEGRASVIVMYSATLTGDRRLFDIREGANYIGFKSLRFRSDIVNQTEQQHLLHWSCTSATETGRAFVEDCYIQYTRGDGLRFLGESTHRVTGIRVTRTIAQMQNLQARTFLSFQRATDNVVADACYNSDVSAIDFEPTGNGSLGRHRFRRNILTGIITLTGTDTADYSERSVFENNVVYDGSVSGLNMRYWHISQNIIHFDTPNVTNFNFALIRRAENVSFSRNLLIRGSNSTSSDAGFMSSERGLSGSIGGITFADNLGAQDVSNTSSVGIQVKDAVNVTLVRNMLFPSVSSAGSANFIAIEAPNDVLEYCVTAHNFGLGLDQRMAGGVSGGGRSVVANGNFFRQVNNGVLLLPVPTDSPTMASNNMLITQSSAVSIIGTAIPNLAVGGIAGDVPLYSVTSSPASAVVAPVGARALRVSGGGAGSTLYVKESGAGTSSGWVAK